MPKQIIIIGPAHPLRGGGMTTFNESLATKLQHEGREVEIWSYTLQYPGFLFPGKSQYTDDPAPDGLMIYPKINSINPLNWISVGRQLRRAAPDIIFVRYWMSFFGPALGTILRYAARPDTRIVTLVDNIIPHEPRVIDAPFNRYFLSASHDFVCMSEEVRDDLAKLTSKPITLTPHPLYESYGEPVDISVARAHIDIPDDGVTTFLFFGFIRRYKGLDMLLDALLELQKKGKKFRLVIAGEFYDSPERYMPRIVALGEHVILRTDFIPNDEVRYYFSSMDYLVLPYHSATQSGVSQVALYYDKPIVCTDVGGLPEFVVDGETGYIAQPESEDLETKLERALEQDSDSFRPAIAEFKKKFSWDLFIQNVGL